MLFSSFPAVFDANKKNNISTTNKINVNHHGVVNKQDFFAYSKT